jgi:hypothetical protein
MKLIRFAILLSATALIGQSCDNADARYIDPNTGNALELKKDDNSGLMVDAETGKPVSIYVDTETKDTVWGSTGKVVNGKLRKNKSADGEYVYVYEDADNDNSDGNGASSAGSESGAYEVKDGDYKKEVEKDGDIKIKDGNKKIKIDGETGERKVKYDN